MNNKDKKLLWEAYMSESIHSPENSCKDDEVFCDVEKKCMPKGEESDKEVSEEGTGSKDHEYDAPHRKADREKFSKDPAYQQLRKRHQDKADAKKRKRNDSDDGVEETFSTNSDDDNYDTSTDLLDQLVNAELDNGATELPVAIENLIGRLKEKLRDSYAAIPGDDIDHLRGGDDASTDPDYNKYM